MANTRINPLHDYGQTAEELASLVLHSSMDQLILIFEEAKKIYKGGDSWIGQSFISLTGMRVRVPEIDLAITSFSSNDHDKNSSEVKKILETGGWEETSFNTTLLRQLVKHIIGYDPDVHLPLDAVIHIKILFLHANMKKHNDEILIAQQLASNRLNEEIAQLSNELRLNLDKLAELIADLNTNKAESEKVAAEIELTKQQLEEFQQEELRLKSDIEKSEVVKKELEAVYAELDFETLPSDKKEEAKKVARAAAWDYIKQQEEIKKGQSERNELSSQMTLQQRKANLEKAFDAKKASEIKLKEEMQQRRPTRSLAAASKNSALGAEIMGFFSTKQQPFLALQQQKKLLEEKQHEKISAEVRKQKLYAEGQVVEGKANVAKAIIIEDYDPATAAAAAPQLPKLVATAKPRQFTSRDKHVTAKPKISLNNANEFKQSSALIGGMFGLLFAKKAAISAVVPATETVNVTSTPADAKLTSPCVLGMPLNIEQEIAPACDNKNPTAALGMSR